jgi:PKD repeat protein
MRKFFSAAAAIALALALSACDDDGSPSGSSGSLRVTCSAAPASGAVPLPVQFTANVSGADSAAVVYWTFGDGTASTQTTASRTYYLPGVYAASVEVRAGGQTQSCNVTVTAQPAPPPAVSTAPNAPPVASFKVSPYPPTGKAPLTVNFNACQSSDPEGDRLLFRFDVFDGLYDSLHCRREHTYRSSGAFQTKICVTDDKPGHADICQDYLVTVQ